VIAGFPTETTEQFENTYKNLSDLPWTRLHVFPYSERQGTRAAVLDQVPMSVRKERAQRLRELSLHRLQSEALKQIGTVKKTLVLNKYSEKQSCLARDYWSLNVPMTADEHEKLKNTEIDLKVISVEVKDSDVVLIAERLEI
jgi:threonylcarbamoyladenosine tRNA methylthiotransferase MtaB